MFAVNAIVTINDPADMVMNGRKAIVRDVAVFGSVVVYTLECADRGWSFAARADKVQS